MKMSVTQGQEEIPYISLISA